jgi:rhodanese-related sulfurtransferase
MSIQGSLVKSITPVDLKQLLAQGNPPLILDVREAEELKICSLPNAIHIPLRNLPVALDRLPEGRSVVTVCHYGRRSLQGALFLKNQGIEQVLNLAGGIDAWAEQVDASMKRY